MPPEGFIKAGPLDRFRAGSGRRVQVGAEHVAVFNVGGRLHALQDACPHMGASLSDGRLDGVRVICHWHGWSFDLASGQGAERSWACARVHEVLVEDGAVWIRIAPPPAPREQPPEPEWVPFDPDSHLRKDGGQT